MAMDDLSDDGVSPPEWQSGSEREPEDDKEIEGNEPTKSHRQTLIRMSVLKKRKTMANGCSA